MYKKTILPNGLTVATHHMAKRVSVSLGIWIKVGARYENVNNAGISHFFEHMVFKGTNNRSCEEIKQAIEGLGGSLNAFTAKECTCYLAKVPRKRFALSLEVLADMVLNAKLAASDIETERKVILEEIRMYKDLPGHLVVDMLNRLLWPNQPLGMNTAGRAKSVRLTSRKSLLNFKQNFYCPNNIIITVCSSLSHQKVLDHCERYFSLSVKKREIGKFTFVSQKQDKPQLNCHIKNTEQTHLALGLYGLSRRDPERFAMALLHTILGANMSSRLFREIREERGLAYEIGTWIKLFHDTGAFIVHAGVDNHRVPEVLEVIIGQLCQMKEKNVGIDELNRAKEYCIGQMMLGLEDTAEHMLWLGESIIDSKKFLSPDQIVQRLRKISAADLRCLAKKLFSNQSLNLALIGPLKDTDRKAIKRALRF